MSELGMVFKPAWPVLKPEYVSDTLCWADRKPLPTDPESALGNPEGVSAQAAVIGVLAVDLFQTEYKFPHLKQALAYKDSKDDIRACILPHEAQLGEFTQETGYLAAALELAPYTTQYAIGLTEYMMPFIEIGGDLGEIGGRIKCLGTFSIDFLQRTEPSLPIIRRLTTK